MEYGGEHRWTARDRAVTARTVQFFDRSESLKVDIGELEDCLLGPEELQIDIRHIALNARGEKHRTPGTWNFLVASVARWDEYARMLVIHEQKCQELLLKNVTMSGEKKKIIEKATHHTPNHTQHTMQHAHHTAHTHRAHNSHSM